MEDRPLGLRCRTRERGPSRRFLLFLFALIPILPVRVVAQERAGVDATIRGQVVDARTEVGISGALVEFLDTRDRIRRRTTADEEGRFVLMRLDPGPFTLRASHPSFVRTQTPRWWVESGDVLTVTIHMHPEVVPLAPLEVTARARTRSPVLSGFYDRLQRRTTGSFITRDEIEDRNPARVTDLLETLPGVTLDHAQGGSARTVVMARSLPGFGRPPGARGDHSCPVQIYVDGMLATRGGAASPDELASPLDLEGVEVYRGLAGVPAEFLTPEARCGVIALWTRRG